MLVKKSKGKVKEDMLKSYSYHFNGKNPVIELKTH
jgi:hypothetical protein